MGTDWLDLVQEWNKWQELLNARNFFTRLELLKKDSAP
jgi:hypothetical protein